MTSLRQVFAAVYRDAVLRTEEEERALQWEGVRAVAHRVLSRGTRGDYGWDRVLSAVVTDPAAAEPAPIVGARIARSWDRALAELAPAAGERHQAVDQRSRMIVQHPGEHRAPTPLRGTIAAGWDRALAEFSAAAKEKQDGRKKREEDGRRPRRRNRKGHYISDTVNEADPAQLPPDYDPDDEDDDGDDEG